MIRQLTYSVLGVVVLASCTNSKNENTLQWLEADSAVAIQSRIRSDFPLSMAEAEDKIKDMYPDVENHVLEEYIKNKQLEVKVIDGQQRVHRKGPDNLKLLNHEIGQTWNGRGSDATEEEISWIDTIVDETKGDGSLSNSHYVKYRFSIDVPRHEFLIGDTLKVWMPLPMETQRQKNVSILTSSHDYIASAGKSEHNTIYMEQPVSENSDSIIHFEYVGEYNVSAQYFSPEFVETNIKEYDKESEFYKKYTAVEHPHIIKIDSLAKQIVGKEESPYKMSEMVYDYIVDSYPWAGAREYSTIECIPQYVISERHGDCGQVALLYISLMRSLGVPARWESGWMLHPGQKNLHDWAEVYFEGIGWVPVDVSFGRYKTSDRREVCNFYSTGMDSYRFATNNGVCSQLYPQKKFLRSETVDFQVGEVECSQGNLFYPGWKKKLEILEMVSVK